MCRWIEPLIGYNLGSGMERWIDATTVLGDAIRCTVATESEVVVDKVTFLFII